jgi:hypothetical protein
MKIHFQCLHLSFQDAPNGIVHTSSRHVNVPEILPPSETAIATTAKTVTESLLPGHAVPLALVNKTTVSAPVRNSDKTTVSVLVRNSELTAGPSHDEILFPRNLFIHSFWD